MPHADAYDAPAAHEPGEPKRAIPLYAKILIALVIGGAIGITLNLLNRAEDGARPYTVIDQAIDSAVNAARGRTGDEFIRYSWVDVTVENVIEPIGKIFLRLVLMVVIPLVFSALTLGVVGVGDVRRLGRIGLRTLIVTAIFSIAAVIIGVGLVNAFRPGDRISAETKAGLQEKYGTSAEANKRVEQAGKAKSLKDTLLGIIPENPLQEMVGALDGSSPGNGMLSVMFFALIFGIAITFTLHQCQPLIAVLENVFTVCMTIIGFAMRLAPLAVGCLFLTITARLGFQILLPLAWFVATVLLGLLIQLVVVYPIALLTLARMNPLNFFRGSLEAMLTAFGTSSSNATLPTAMRVANENLGLSPDISHFVLTVGATGNQNGTALFEGVVVLFLAQLFGVELTIGQQISVVMMSVLAGIGTAGVPGGSIPLIVVVMQSVGVPAEGIGIILGVDRILDMSRTVLNVTGDLAVATCVARMEGTSPQASSGATST
jgi:DAACS family dicarboxylate/amino acid:cation (Na+ or H+) symporter